MFIKMGNPVEAGFAHDNTALSRIGTRAKEGQAGYGTGQMDG
jgi:hypothetical protein